ncbi:MAG: SRPBCC family protein [Syntrophothermus sp.]
MPRVHAVDCDAPPDRLWALVARPDRWAEWSPHVKGADGLGAPEVAAGASGHVILRGGLRIPARVTQVSPGESWSWQVGGLVVHHTVRPLPGGRSRLEQVVEGTARPWSAVALAYGPVVGLIGRNVARVAERG